MRTIGIDVSKATLDAALQDEQGNVVKEERVKNSTSGLRTLLRKWTRQGLCDTRALVCLEPTGHYSHGVVKTLVDMRYPTWLAHATDIRLSIGMQRGKSDTVDAPRIAQYAHRFRDKARLVGQAHLAFAELTALLALRERLVKERAKDKAQLSDNVLHLTGSAKELVKAELQRQLKALERSITKLDKAISAFLRKDSALQRKNKLAQSVSGIRPVLVSELIAHTAGFTRFDPPRQLVCSVGAAPFERTSGSSVRGKTATSSFANHRLKSLFKLAALAAVRVPGDLQATTNASLRKANGPSSP